MALEFSTSKFGSTGRGSEGSLSQKRTKYFLIRRRAIIVDYKGLKINNVLVDTARMFSFL